ncbi:MAG: biotin/lipoyl-binding protein, partial [Desulfuromonas sp.]|nr:biotin/lipoyl-binding protein [Desulfuromonas sp.]
MSDFCMPSLGADMKSGTLVEWLVAEGDTVQHGQSIAVIETAKGAIEIESFVDGVVEEIVCQPGDEEIAIGSVLARISA